MTAHERAARVRMARRARMSEEEVLALPPAITLDELARAWGMGKSTAWERLQAGTLGIEPLPFGRPIRFRKADALRALGIDPAPTTSASA